MVRTGVSGEGRGSMEEEAENPDFMIRRTMKANVRWLDVAGDGPGGLGAGAKVRAREVPDLSVSTCRV